MICFVEGAFIKWCDWSFWINLSYKYYIIKMIITNKNWPKYTWRAKSVATHMADVITTLLASNFIFNADGNKSTNNAKLYIVEGKVIGNLNSGRKWHFRTKHRWWLGRITSLVCVEKSPRSGRPTVLTNANRHWKWDSYFFTMALMLLYKLMAI